MGRICHSLHLLPGLGRILLSLSNRKHNYQLTMWQEIAVYLIGCVTIFWMGHKNLSFFYPSYIRQIKLPKLSDLSTQKTRMPNFLTPNQEVGRFFPILKMRSKEIIFFPYRFHTLHRNNLAIKAMSPCVNP